MYSIASVIHRLFLAIIVLVPFPVWAEDTAIVQPDVRAILFFAPDTAQYRDLFAYYLPGLLERNKDRLEISTIDASRASGAAAYQAATADFGLPSQWDGTPSILGACPIID